MIYSMNFETERMRGVQAPAATEDQELKADRGYILAVAGLKADATRIARELEERYRRTGEVDSRDACLTMGSDIVAGDEPPI